MYQSLVEGRAVGWELLVKDVPPEHHKDLEYLLDMMDWPANTDPEFEEHRRFEPAPVAPAAQMKDAGYSENWVVYSTPHYSAKELTVFPQADRHYQRRRRLWNDSGSRLRHAGQA